MNGRHAICLVIDGLRASALGCYGNTVSRTPHFDQLSGRAAVVEWLWADSPLLSDFYKAAWQGTHAARVADARQTVQLPALLKADGTAFRLITDEPLLSDRIDGIEKLAVIDTATETAASDLSETAFARLCTETVEHLDEWLDDGAGSLTWIHARGLHGAWDAPPELRSELLEEDDPPALEFLQPPDEIRPVVDPDQLLLYRTAYAAQVTVIDACFGALLEAIEEIMADRETLLIVTSSRGFALGEHDAIGTACCDLFSEQLHLPLLLRVCDDMDTPGPRLAGLAQVSDLQATLLDWLGIPPPTATDGRSILPHLEEQNHLPREIALSLGSNNQTSLLTPDWLWRQPSAGAQQLFAKPDDRWEHNDVAIRCPKELDQLAELASQFIQYAESGKPLPETLGETELG